MSSDWLTGCDSSPCEWHSLDLQATRWYKSCFLAWKCSMIGCHSPVKHYGWHPLRNSQTWRILPWKNLHYKVKDKFQTFWRGNSKQDITENLKKALEPYDRDEHRQVKQEWFEIFPWLECDSEVVQASAGSDSEDVLLQTLRCSWQKEHFYIWKISSQTQKRWFLKTWEDGWPEIAHSSWGKEKLLQGCCNHFLLQYERSINQSNFYSANIPSQAQWRKIQISAQQQKRWSSSTLSTGDQACRWLWGKGQVKKICLETFPEGGNWSGWTDW